MEQKKKDSNRDAYPILVVGIGPGSKDYVLPAALRAIASADILVGGRRALADYAREEQEQIVIGADIEAVLHGIDEARQRARVVVLVSGDPGYFSLLDALKRRFLDEPIEVIPGISSLQMAFSRLAIPWHEAKFLSFHGRTPSDAVLAYEEGAVLGLLTDAKQNSKTIPEKLLSLGWKREAKLYILSRLSYEDESIIETTLGEAVELPAVSHGILVVCA
ncbi:precorrin-6y C5,15-methyltransferase (decarboxylating) subunit CbiE [Selenomonas sp. TAMA-11512]|uniref:precorrin-6y C5,15-methyltransferase (decarboxylating) subunit CbiE n=1 Tax=Selenomonas sp. TAMA-11512 TaxID=3095337 RepID=UPI00308A7D7D|nr:precorrin-6y C5,15-methyltransferase (decarboxylating) subunit CbiE [Selenomonas sp. TAMA-11512]